MISTNRLILMLLTLSFALGASTSVRKSYETLKDRTAPTHATPHINNLIRNGPEQLDESKKGDLKDPPLIRKKHLTIMM